MNSLYRCVTFVVLLPLLLGQTLVYAAAAELLRPAVVRSVVIAPDGSHLAMVRSGPDRDTAIIFQRPDMKIVSGVSSALGERFNTITWANAQRLLIEPALAASPTAGPVAPARATGALMALSVNGVRKRLLVANPQGPQLASVIVSLLPDDPVHVLASTGADCKAQPCTGQQRLVKINIETGTSAMLGTPIPMAGYFVSDPAGDRILAAGTRPSGKVEVVQLRAGLWQSVSTFDPRTELGVVPLSLDTRGTLFALANKLGSAALYRWNLQTGATEEVARDAAADIDGFVYSFGGRELLAVRSDPGFPRWHYLQTEHGFAGTHKSLRAAHPDSDVDVTSFTADGTEAVVRVHSDRNVGDFYIVNTKTRETQLLATSRSWLTTSSLAKLQPLEVTTRDDFKLRGYVAVPAAQGPHPLVLIIRDQQNSTQVAWAWNPEVQMLVDAGYATLLINYRGSTGYGQYYTAAGGERDGRFVQRDIVDAVRWAVEQNIADGRRVCVLGRGYGAFAAVKALTMNADLYRCGVAIDGFYDLSAPYSPPDAMPMTPVSLLYALSHLDLDAIDRSPIKRLSNIDAPLLLIGESAQTIELRDAMRAANKDVEWHGQAIEAADYEAILAFLNQSMVQLTNPVLESPAVFSLTNAQAVAFQQIVDKMRQDTKLLAKRKALSLPAIRRQIRDLIDSHDSAVRALVSDQQWGLYGAHKATLATELEADLDIVKVR